MLDLLPQFSRFTSSQMIHENIKATAVNQAYNDYMVVHSTKHFQSASFKRESHILLKFINFDIGN